MHESFAPHRYRLRIEMRVSAVEGFVLKRGVDIALAALLLTVSLPLLAMAAIAIKLDSEGPVLFRQARMGRRFRRFQIWKLRTMVNCRRGPAYTLSEDPRITRAGRWLRRHKVDELPQLWNVIRGEMSLVGPRPVVPELALECRQAYKRLLKVRPGLTDPATLKYCHEEESLSLVPDPHRFYKTIVVPDKLRISAAYLEHANLRSDLGVMARTALVLVPASWLPRFIRSFLAGQTEAVERLFP
jgi:lipopolysaccharide/colanic/teichoic acid biosynthesis glycosyltransferase